MKLYSYYRSTSSYRVRIVLHAKGLSYDYHAVNLDPGVAEQTADGFDRVSGMRQVPVLEWDEGGVTRRLTQSVAIAEFLDDRYPAPPLLPDEPLPRARVREMVEVVNAGIQPLQNVRTLGMVREHAGEAAARSWATEAILRGLRTIEALGRAQGGDFLVGDAWSLAEVFVIPQLYNARRFGVDMTGLEKLLDVDARCSTLDAFARAHPDRQPDAPARAGGGSP